MNDRALLSARGITKIYGQGEQRLEILKGLTLDVYPGEALCIVGSSGAGKSTFLHILGTLDQPTAGQVFYKSEDLTKKSEEDLSRFRNKKIGFVFQFHHLLSEFTAFENIILPGRIGGVSPRDCRSRAERLLSILGISSRKHHYPSQLSGGEQQRVAIARSLMREPELLLADEPTGNLDTENSRRIQDLFFELKERLGITLVVVTHDQRFAGRFPRVKRMADGHWVDSFF